MRGSRSLRESLRGWTARVVWSAVLIFATVVVGGAFDARRRLADLQPWHRLVPRDFRASDLTPESTLASYLAIEDAAFRTVHDWMAGGTVTSCDKDPDGTWTCSIEHPDGARTVVWNPEATVAVPAPEGATTAEEVGGKARDIEAGATVEVGAVPVSFS